MIERPWTKAEIYYWSLMEAVQVTGRVSGADKIAAASIEAWRGFVNQRAEMTRKAK